MIIDEDPIGPLCFNAFNLYNYYYLNRFKGLWNPPEGQFEGYYGDLVGAGPDLEIKSRGSNPEKYLFRLPIIDCYLPPEHNFSIITMGPKLSNEDIEKIDKILITRGKNFIKLKNIKENYDCAIINNKKDSRFIKYKNKLSLDLTEDEKKNKYLNYSGFIAINVINEILVRKFLNKEILFSDIVRKLLGFLKSRTVKNYLKNNRIQHINDVFKAYNFYRSLLV